MEKQIKVIICADDGEWSRENTDALASRGAQVVTVNRNGTALLTKIRDEKPDVVVMDLFMAGVFVFVTGSDIIIAISAHTKGRRCLFPCSAVYLNDGDRIQPIIRTAEC